MTLRIIIGIDPGQNTGIAIYRDGVLAELRTIEPVQIDALLNEQRPYRVVFEDSRLQSNVWTSVKGPAALKVARNIGEIDAWCRLITAICARMGIDAHGISPKHKGAKLNAAQFSQVTGWAQKSNQHERDGAMTAWAYRRART